MTNNPKEGGLCWHCRRPAADEDNFCRFCGKDLRSFPWYYQHWGIIAATLLALGPLSLLLVWRSPVLSKRSRWIYTAAIGWLTYYICAQTYQAWLLLKAMLGAGSMNIGL
ncbi:MAG TPA: hypothetical protein DEB40_04660 [Elusimicrobia bacterium]|nr:hypothetical protein [Elusimicrobiota bacterium]HBT61015.1 hypothetical protein [Elusimicrobiota bacterium]